MSKEIAKSDIEQLRALHNEILLSARSSLDRAIRAGAILQRIKSKLKHGEWIPWIEKNAGFSEKTAQNYLRCHEHRKELIGQLNMGESLKLLAEKNPITKKKRKEAQKNRGPIEHTGDPKFDALIKSNGQLAEKVEILQEGEKETTKEIQRLRKENEKINKLNLSLDGAITLREESAKLKDERIKNLLSENQEIGKHVEKASSEIERLQKENEALKAQKPANESPKVASGTIQWGLSWKAFHDGVWKAYWTQEPYREKNDSMKAQQGATVILRIIKEKFFQEV